MHDGRVVDTVGIWKERIHCLYIQHHDIQKNDGLGTVVVGLYYCDNIGETVVGGEGI